MDGDGCQGRRRVLDRFPRAVVGLDVNQLVRTSFTLRLRACRGPLLRGNSPARVVPLAFALDPEFSAGDDYGIAPNARRCRVYENDVTRAVGDRDAYGKRRENQGQ
jgi:hypothetical protein